MTRSNTEVTFDSATESEPDHEPIHVGNVYTEGEYPTALTIEVTARVAEDTYRVVWNGEEREFTTEKILDIVDTFDYELVEAGEETPAPAADDADTLDVDQFEEGDEVRVTYTMTSDDSITHRNATVEAVHDGKFGHKYLDLDLDIEGYEPTLRVENIARIVRAVEADNTIASNAEVQLR